MYLTGGSGHFYSKQKSDKWRNWLTDRSPLEKWNKQPETTHMFQAMWHLKCCSGKCYRSVQAQWNFWYFFDNQPQWCDAAPLELKAVPIPSQQRSWTQLRTAQSGFLEPLHFFPSGPWHSKGHGRGLVGVQRISSAHLPTTSQPNGTCSYSLPHFKRGGGQTCSVQL